VATDWYMEGPYLKNCNCDSGCPCDFNQHPTHGHCEGMAGMADRPRQVRRRRPERPDRARSHRAWQFVDGDCDPQTRRASRSSSRSAERSHSSAHRFLQQRFFSRAPIVTSSLALKSASTSESMSEVETEF
jgi:hypothetical protein